MSKCPHCGQEMKVEKVRGSRNGWIYVPQLKIYIEKDVHHKGYSYNQLKEIYGKKFEKMLLNKKQVEFLRGNSEYRNIFKLNTWTNDFFIQQYDKDNQKRGLVAVFYAGEGWSYFDSDRGSDFAGKFRGVRFCRKKISSLNKIKEKK